MTRLRSCEGCSRHVLVSERTCPFCQRELAPLPERPPVQHMPGLSRAQRLALAAAAAAGPALSACMQSVPVYGAPAPQMEAGTNAGGAGAGAGRAGSEPPTAVPVYGAPLAGQPGPGGTAGRGASGNGSVVMPVYGVPVSGRSGQPDKPDAGDADDAGVPPRDGGPMVQPLYGASPAPVYGAPTPQR